MSVLAQQQNPLRGNAAVGALNFQETATERWPPLHDVAALFSDPGDRRGVEDLIEDWRDKDDGYLSPQVCNADDESEEEEEEVEEDAEESFQRPPKKRRRRSPMRRQNLLLRPLTHRFSLRSQAPLPRA
jgi:hypothetical protein